VWGLLRVRGGNLKKYGKTAEKWVLFKKRVLNSDNLTS
jgi:hypothetical protein